MKLSYSCAIVSFCPDLTARDAPSIPVGVLLVGQLGDNGLASVLVPSVRMPRLDEVTREVLMSVPDLLRLHVHEVLEREPTPPAAEILRGLHEKLRNSLFVSTISDEASVDVNAEDLPATLTRLMVSTYTNAVEKSGWTIGEGAPSPRPPESRQIDLGAIHDVNSMWRYEATAASRAS